MKKLLCICLIMMLIAGLSVAAMANTDPTDPSDPISEPVETDPTEATAITEPTGATRPSEPVTPGVVTLTPAGSTLPGQTVTIVVSVSNSSPVDACLYETIFDQTLFALDSVTALITPSNLAFGNTIAFPAPTDINTNLIAIILRVLDTTQPGQYEVACSLNASIEDIEISYGTSFCTVTVDCPHTYVEDPLVEGALATPATCVQSAFYYQSCSLCGAINTELPTFPYGEVLPHVFDAQVIAPEYLKDPGTCSKLQIYCLSCSVCGLRSPNEDTEIFQPDGYFGDHIYDNACDTWCNECGRFQEASHIAGTEWFSNADEHWHKCVTCNMDIDHQDHQPGPMSAGDTSQVCAICQYVMDDGEDAHICSYGDQWKSNDNNHWLECDCGKMANMGAHQWDDGTVVTEATEDQSGLMVYTCTTCQHQRQQSIPATGGSQEETDYPSLPTVPVQQVVVEKDSGPNVLAIVLGILLVLSLIGNGVLAFFVYMFTRRRPQRRKK